MAGVEPTGFVTKRLPEILASLRARAIEIFQDITPPGEIVDTSDSSTIGRQIGLISPSLADLWEASQQVYSAFDPNSATGIALDNLVALGGVTRLRNTYSTAQAIFTGSNGTLIPAGSAVSSPVTGESFNVVASVALSPSLASGVTVSVPTVADTTLYAISYSRLATTQTASFTSGVDATAVSILSGLKAEIDSNHPQLIATVIGSTLEIDLDDIFQLTSFSVSANLGVTKVDKIGDLQAQNFGPVEQAPNTITTITTPVLGWDSVNNPTSASVGRFIETDEQLRQRFRQTKFVSASNILEALYSALTNLDGVEEVVIYENDKNVTDANGVPAHSFMPIILGGISTNLGQTIWQNKPLGIRSYGNTTVSIFDSQGFPHDIGFERPNPVDIYISLDISTNSDFPQSGEDAIKDALAAYMEDKFGIGDEIIYSRLYTPVNSVPGHQVNSMTIGTSASPIGVSNIPLAFNELFSLNPDNIVITVT